MRTPDRVFRKRHLARIHKAVTVYCGEVETPVGWLRVTVVDSAVTEVRWGRASAGSHNPVLTQALGELRAYFEGELTEFSVPLAPAGGELLQGVLAQMLAIPFGETRTYGDIAKAIDAPAQAVGQACGANPIPIIIPCHRVLAAGRNIGGYSGSGGIDTKRFLLSLEGAAFNT